MKKRLFSFDVAWTIAFLLVQIFVYFIAISALIEAANKLGPIIALVIITSILALIVYLFGFSVPIIDDDAIRHGKKIILKMNASARIEFNERFNEMEIIVTDNTVDYSELSHKEMKKYVFEISATSRNIKTVELWLGHGLYVPPKPKNIKHWWRRKQ